MTPLQQYQNAIQNGEFVYDVQQEQIANALQQLFEQIIDQKKSSLFHKAKNLFKEKQSPKGLYIWGSVGAGKTWLMDIFYNSLFLLAF